MRSSRPAPGAPGGDPPKTGRRWGPGVIRIDAITVPEGGGEDLARRFAPRAGPVDSADRFEGFELLRPTAGRQTWLGVTRGRDAEAFEAWVSSPAFAHGHRGASSEGADRPPVAAHSELWAYDVEVSARGNGADARLATRPTHVSLWAAGAPCCSTAEEPYVVYNDSAHSVREFMRSTYRMPSR
jgi:heme oxygenase (mycobilin-producing)